MLVLQLSVGAFGLAACAGDRSVTPTVADVEHPPVIYRLSGDLAEVHDPSVIEANGTFYLFSTGRLADERIPIRCSGDLLSWRRCGDVFAAIPEWARKAVPGVRDLWAPDISFFGGRFHVYYAVSTFGSRHSAIGLATNATLDPRQPGYAWRDEGLVIASTETDDWNAIDPNIVFDSGGRPWLALGSYWSGIKLTRVDPETGKPPANDPQLYALAARPPDASVIEAPFIVRRGGFYYLFVSYDLCCKGAESTYKIMVGRSSHLTGPYVDRDGTPMLNGGATLVLAGGSRWRGPGHNAVLRRGAGDLIVYHAYDASDGGVPKLRIGTLEWTADGWPAAAAADADERPVAALM